MFKVDKTSAIQLAKNQTYHGRTTHIGVHHHFVREEVEGGVLVVEYCPTEEQVADMETEGIMLFRFTWEGGSVESADVIVS